MGTGDGGGAGDPDGNAQNRNVAARQAAADRPRSAQAATGRPNVEPVRRRRGRDEIYALGLRNPYRFSFDSRSGDILIGDVGQDAWEEIDHVSRARLGGSNFGWDLLEGNHDFEGRKPPGPLPAAGARVLLARRRLRGHRRLRRPRPAAAGARRPLPVRRLLQRRDPLVRPVAARANATPPTGLAGRPAELVRRGAPAAPSTSPRSPARSTGSSRAEPPPALGRSCQSAGIVRCDALTRHAKGR